MGGGSYVDTSLKVLLRGAAAKPTANGDDANGEVDMIDEESERESDLDQAVSHASLFLIYGTLNENV